MERKERNPYFQVVKFGRMKRQMTAMALRGEEIPAEMVEKHKSIDVWLSQNSPRWVPNYRPSGWGTVKTNTTDRSGW